MGDTVDGYIVVSGSHPAGSENEIELLGERRNFFADELDNILYRRDLLHFDAQLAQLGAEEIRVDIVSLSRQNFVANDDDAGSFRHSAYLFILSQ